MIKRLRHFLQNNKVCIKIYAMLKWHERINAIKQCFFDQKAKKRGFIFSPQKTKARFFLPYYKEDYIQKQILLTQNYYEFDYLTKICSQWRNGVIQKSINNGIILDIGSNIGNHTLFFLLEKGAKKAYCFEPIKDTFSILKKNIQINGLSNNVQLYNSAVGEQNGNASISHYDKQNIGSTSIQLNKEGDIDIISIDSLNIPEKIDFIKIDVEGFEIAVIKGLLQTIQKSKPIIMIEIRDKNFTVIENLLCPLDYQNEIFAHNDDYGDYLFFPAQ